MDVSHVFFGHTCGPGASFDLSSNDGQRALSVKMLSLEEVVTPMFGMSIDRGPLGKPIVLPVMEDGTLRFEHHPRFIRNGRQEQRRFISLRWKRSIPRRWVKCGTPSWPRAVRRKSSTT